MLISNEIQRTLFEWHGCCSYLGVGGGRSFLCVSRRMRILANIIVKVGGNEMRGVANLRSRN